MYTYKLLIAYDGTSYFGWQQQPNRKTVQGTMLQQFVRVFNRPISMLGASRTDAGVHALGQVAECRTDLSIDPALLLKAWNGRLPHDITIRCLEPSGSDFHPHINVLQKTYDYYIFHKRPLPFMARYGWYVSKSFDIDKIYDAMQVFVGTHDFRSFCTGDHYESTVRTVDSCDVDFMGRLQAFRIRVKGPRFMRYMIRRMVGAALHVASHDDYTHTDVQEALERKSPAQQLITAPPHGLVLRKIIYGNETP